jgi:hypothetical protein
VNRAVRLHRKTRANTLAEYHTALISQGHCVSGGWPLTAEEGRPIIIEVAKDRRNLERENLHILQLGAAEEPAERLGTT